MAGLIAALVILVGIVFILGWFLHKEHGDKLEAVDIAKHAKDLAFSEYQRALKDGKRLVYEFAVHANANLWEAEGTPFYQAKVRAVLQDAVNKFNPAKNDLAE